jgi:hypothetical protein
MCPCADYCQTLFSVQVIRLQFRWEGFYNEAGQVARFGRKYCFLLGTWSEVLGSNTALNRINSLMVWWQWQYLALVKVIVEVKGLFATALSSSLQNEATRVQNRREPTLSLRFTWVLSSSGILPSVGWLSTHVSGLPIRLIF